MPVLKFVLKALKKIGWGILMAIDWLFMALTAPRRTTSMDDSNARYGLDQRDPLGEKVGFSGPRPGERAPPRD